MKKNKLIKVYQDPISDRKFEGLATLVQHHPSEDDAEIGQRWTVRFADGHECDRWVNKRNLVES